MPWQKGESGNKNGRPKLNEVEKKNVTYFKQQLRRYSKVALEELIKLMTNSVNEDVKFKCATYVLNHTYGKDFIAELDEQSNEQNITINLLSVGEQYTLTEQDKEDIEKAEQGIPLEKEEDMESWEMDSTDDDWEQDVYDG